MMCYENSEDDTNGNRDDENKQDSKNPEADERKVGPGEEPQGTPLMQLYISNVFTTGIMNEWAMSTIEDNLATPRVPSQLKHG